MHYLTSLWRPTDDNTDHADALLRALEADPRVLVHGFGRISRAGFVVEVRKDKPDGRHPFRFAQRLGSPATPSLQPTTQPTQANHTFHHLRRPSAAAAGAGEGGGEGIPRPPRPWRRWA